MMVINAVVPSFVIAFIGFSLSKLDPNMSKKTVSNLVYYIFSPCLIFSSLYKRSFDPSEFGVIALAVVLLIAAMMVIGFFLKRMENVKENGYYLPVAFMSTGTISIPIALLLYGNEGMAKAVMFHAVNIMFLYSFGVWLVSKRFELREFLKIPALWATFLGIGVSMLPPGEPGPQQEFFWLMAKGVDMIGLGAIPLLIISFGYSLSETKWAEMKSGVAGGFSRILIGPALAFIMIFAFRKMGIMPLDPGYDILKNLDLRTTEAVIILNAAMPGPIMAYMLNVKFDSCPKLAVAILSVGTVGGIFSIPLVLGLINHFIFG